MKNLALVIGLAGVVFASSNICLAGDKPATTPAVPAAKKDSGHAVSAPAGKSITPNHISPALPKPGLPVDAGKPRGTASVGGPNGASGHRDGMLNGTEIKWHP
ncbi:MAG TPA: hypothetical protein VKV04_25880 [Verrucomicrobiae bacterium]|nr:hypothetical protein [Verrucomicrobiae bacterium]